MYNGKQYEYQSGVVIYNLNGSQDGSYKYNDLLKKELEKHKEYKSELKSINAKLMKSINELNTNLKQEVSQLDTFASLEMTAIIDDLNNLHANAEEHSFEVKDKGKTDIVKDFSLDIRVKEECEKICTKYEKKICCFKSEAIKKYYSLRISFEKKEDKELDDLKSVYPKLFYSIASVFIKPVHQVVTW